MIRKNRLTSTNGYRTVVHAIGECEKVDATTKNLLRQLQELEREGWRIRDKTRSIHVALKLAGIKPDARTLLGGQDSHEYQYAVKQPFAHATLTEACEQVLKDYADNWLTKSQVEYLITRGGYKSSAKDAKNSVDVTLRRLAGDGKCDVKRVRGSRGNTYRWISPEVKEKQE